MYSTCTVFIVYFDVSIAGYLASVFPGKSYKHLQVQILFSSQKDKVVCMKLKNND